MASDGSSNAGQNGHLFLPRRLQRRKFLVWLKRVHAWTGFWGALLFIFLGVSGIILDHRAVMRWDTGAPVEVASFERVVPAGEITSPEELTTWMQREFDIAKGPSRGRRAPPQAVAFNGQPQEQAASWSVRFSGPNGAISATFLPEVNLLSVTKTESNAWSVIKDLHKGVGTSVPWILLMDAMAGALIFMGLTGIVLWTRLHGTRIAALGILLGSTGFALAVIYPTLITAAIE